MTAIFDIEDFETQAGARLDLRLAYRTIGHLNDARDNVVVVTTSYAAQDDEAEQIVGAPNGVDLDRYCVVLINMIGNGASSSPSNTAAPFDGPRFPLVSVHDNVKAQRQLIDHLGVTRVRLAAGYSMGGLQAFEWGAQHADIVDAVLPICGAARVSPHDRLFLDGAKAALQADAAFAGGDYSEPPDVGLRAFARVYAGWAMSQAFYRNGLYQTLGLADVESTVAFMHNYFARRDANDLLAMLATWQHADISRNPIYGGDFERALGATTARTIVMPSTTDLYFTVADSAIKVTHLANAELRPIESDFGHVAGSGLVPEGKVMIDQAINELLDG